MKLYPRKNVDSELEKASRSLASEFAGSFGTYLQTRVRQLYMFSYATGLVLGGSLEEVKAWAVRRMFWGRSSLYRSAFHSIVSIVTIVAVISGLSTRLNVVTSASERSGLDLNSGILGRQDIFSQAGTAESIGSVGENEKDYPEYKHIVERGETLSEIAGIYQISESTIKWANDLTSETLNVGQVLRIPGIDGVFIKVEEGDTLESIADEHQGNVADIIDLNSDVLDPRNPELKVGMELFIPSGVIPTPVPARRVYYSNPQPQPPAVGDPGGISVPSGTFVHPLGTDPGCAGWTWSRGFSPWHGGADMAKSGGCWINAAGSGTVIRAGWGNGGEGYNVVIDHGNGIHTLYYHGSGAFAVSVGQSVQAGQKILYMGSTGYSTGTHLHLEVRVNGYKVNPEAYINLR